jgi:hypothetical protein
MKTGTEKSISARRVKVAVVAPHRWSIFALLERAETIVGADRHVLDGKLGKPHLVSDVGRDRLAQRDRIASRLADGAGAFCEQRDPLSIVPGPKIRTRASSEIARGNRIGHHCHWLGQRAELVRQRTRQPLAIPRWDADQAREAAITQHADALAVCARVGVPCAAAGYRPAAGRRRDSGPDVYRQIMHVRVAHNDPVHELVPEPNGHRWGLAAGNLRPSG